MMTFLLLITLWGAVWLCYLNNLPPYRRQNPCHLPPPGPLQHSIRLAGPFITLALSYSLAGLDGLFLWGFSAPLTGALLGITLPYLPKEQVRKTVPNDHYLQK